jgi:hypothetical protein
MATTEVIRDIPKNDLFPVDPNVTIPKHVRDAAAAADAIHKQAYEEPQPAPQTEQQQDQQVQQPEPQAAQTVETQPQPQPQPQPQLPPDNYTGTPNAQELADSVWAPRYNSMRGRWESSQRQIGAMQEQMNDLAAELQRAQALLTNGGQRAPQPAPQQQQTHKQLITDQDREDYGDGLIDVARRAAMEVVSPELDALRAENGELKKRVTTTAQSELRQSLAGQIPDWIAINRSDAFKRWLSLRNIYTGEVRGVMLNAAYAAADAPKVIAIFKDFINEVKATGGELPSARQEQQQQVPQPAAPRTPAIQLETLAAPGRARPAGGDANLPADKPTYTRQQIANFYADVRRSVYSGRETEKARIEADIIAAQSEGRVRG